MGFLLSPFDCYYKPDILLLVGFIAYPIYIFFRSGLKSLCKLLDQLNEII